MTAIKENSMNTVYEFTNSQGKWQLEFPNVDLALYHAKIHKAKCTINDTVIAEWKPNGIGGYKFVNHMEGKEYHENI